MPFGMSLADTRLVLNTRVLATTSVANSALRRGLGVYCHFTPLIGSVSGCAYLLPGGGTLLLTCAARKIHGSGRCFFRAIRAR